MGFISLSFVSLAVSCIREVCIGVGSMRMEIRVCA